MDWTVWRVPKFDFQPNKTQTHVGHRINGCKWRKPVVLFLGWQRRGVRCLVAVPVVPGVIFTLTCSVAPVSLSVFGVWDRVMQANLFIELFGGFETQISTLKALSVSHIMFSYKILNFSNAQVDPLYKNMLFHFCTIINGQLVHGTSWHFTHQQIEFW